MSASTYRVPRIDAASVEELDLAALNGDGAPRDGTEPEDLIHDNTRKAGFAAAAIVAYAAVTGGFEEWATVFGDLLGDLHHLADALDVDIDAAIDTGRRYYQDEIRGEV
jgi:hypothetical protein